MYTMSDKERREIIERETNPSDPLQNGEFVILFVIFTVFSLFMSHLFIG